MSNATDGRTAVLTSAAEPSEEQKARFLTFLRGKYGEDVTLSWKMDESLIGGGFRLQIGAEVYDWTMESRLRQMKDELHRFALKDQPVIPLMRKSLETWSPSLEPEEQGRVLTVGDGIATVSGLSQATYGEILLFPGGIKGMVQNLGRDEIGCILFGDDQSISEGDLVTRSLRTAGVPVGEGFIGRVVDALGNPIDGKGPIEAEDYLPIEKPAPGIIDRQPVDQPLETGLLAIDSMFPIGRGQRELIIGDRQTGKTAIAIDTILNQKGKNVICIYVAIGQKNSSIAQLTEALKKHGAQDYTIVINASASDAVPMQYIAPYSGCAMAEFFMYKGRDVLIVYDDLSKHAVAYRALSLLLGRSPGREAYPGDVFYLHSRLLERAAHLSDERGGGSMTALPIVETQAGDVSAYIPTNIISITDGQIFLESELFFAGQRPAVNVGLSVSRVGGNAQTKAMKKAVGTLRLDLAQYREMEVFTQFSSDLDEATRKQLRYGQGLMRILRQQQYHPMSLCRQVITLVAALAHRLQDVPQNQMTEVSDGIFAAVKDQAADLCRSIDRGSALSESDKQRIIQIADKYLKTLKG